MPELEKSETGVNRAGFAYAAVLILVTIIMVMALTFISRVGVEAAAAMSSRKTTQADYLARAAANHAMYLLLNDLNFPVNEDRYYMHDLGPGRYGYMVRRHTSTTFAAVACMGIVGDTVIKRSYVLYVKP